MEAVWQWGIDIIKVIQTLRSPFLDSFFIFISALGKPAAYMIFLSGIYWIFDRKWGARIIILFYFSGWVNSTLKDLIGHSRPYVLDQTVKVGHSGGPGLPSGHSQQSFVVLGAAALWIRRRGFTAAAAVLIVLIAFSRMYLGVHFPTDIIGGWLAAAVLLIVFMILCDKAENYIKRIRPSVLLGFSVFLPVLISLTMPGKFSVMSLGSLSGFCAGLITEGKSESSGPFPGFKKGLLRYISGMAGTVILLSAGMVITKNFFHGSLISIFITFWAVNFWIAAGAPRLFARLKL